MNINIKRKENKELLENQINVLIEYKKKNKDVNELEIYISRYEDTKKEIFAKENNVLVPLSKEDIIKIYSEGKTNYCKTIKGKYELKSKLYEIEKMDEKFMRISKSCIVNINHIKHFDLSYTGKIFIKFDDNTEELVSRRKARDVLFYLDERRM